MISNEVIYFRLANNIENDPQIFSHQQSRKPVTVSIFKNDYSSDSCVCQFIHIYIHTVCGTSRFLHSFTIKKKVDSNRTMDTVKLHAIMPLLSISIPFFS